MNIALFGYGKMGKAIEKIAQSRGHTIVEKIDNNDNIYSFSKADVAIDFSIPSAAAKNITRALQKGIPVISGTTGWLSDYNKIVNLCGKINGAFLYASNFSLGVNLFFELNNNLAQMMSQLKAYDASITETHHKQKLDAPSGTAITLAENIIKNSSYKQWSLDKKSLEILEISSKRLDDITGIHTVTYSSNEDSIEIKHTSKNREGFALGAIVAAEWIIGRKGIFTMKDVLNIS
ncbi:4-hydroxy-tetrahydrodipicolinate reductase [Flavobacteriaceae bacterium]|jgi:4-hydroxy-tetrahydrodipicolinate reductase|nr:4-hydroxy-tetrahydrodipicolinate reductase [Flavobacteriaceae bacterium]